MGRIVDFFYTSQVLTQQLPQVQNVKPVQNSEMPNDVGIPTNQRQQQLVRQVVEPLIHREVERNP